VKKSNQVEFGIRSETGELYLLNKQERALTIEVLKMALATEGGREFLVERFGKEGIKMALSLLREMGVETTQYKGRRQELSRSLGLASTIPSA
jgi:hypothetical protein